MKRKPKTPYQHLLEDIKQFAARVRYRPTAIMWRYPKKRIAEGWSLADLFERVAAAEQLGYDVLLVADDEGLLVKYRKKLPEVPYQW